MKDPYCIRFSPPRHWTDHMLRVHAFSCVLALTLVSLLHRRVSQAGVAITQSRLMEQLKGIKEITNYYPAQSGEKLRQGGRPRSERTLSWPVSIYTLPLGPEPQKPAKNGPLRLLGW